MRDISFMRMISITLPSGPQGGKRDRTRAQLLAAAEQLFAEKGIEAASIQEMAARAGVANGTFYNHFRTKEAVLEAVATGLAIGLCERIDESARSIPDGAERMAIGNRRYIGLALEQPERARLMLAVSAVASPELVGRVDRYMEADLRLGMAQGRFTIARVKSAKDVISGSVLTAMHRAVSGPVPRGYPSEIAAMVLRALGMAGEEADAVARRPLPPLPRLPPPPRG